MPENVVTGDYAGPFDPDWTLGLAEMCGGGGLRHFDLTERRVEIQRS